MSITQNTTFASREVSDLTFVDYETQAPFLFCDYANTSGVEITGDSVFAYGGKGHVKRATFYGEKAGTMTVETQITTMKLYQLVSGGTAGTTASWLKRDVVTASGSAESPELTLTGLTASSTCQVYALADDCGTEIAGSAGAGKWTPTTPASITVGEKYAIYHMTSLTGVQTVSIKDSSVPKSFAIYAETLNRTEDDQLVPYKMIVYKASPQLNFSISQSNNGDPVTMTITLDILANADGAMIDLILEEDE